MSDCTQRRTRPFGVLATESSEDAANNTQKDVNRGEIDSKLYTVLEL